MPFTLSRAQLTTYLEYIRIPDSTFPSSLSVENLDLLHTHHIGNLPYTNLNLHYGGPPTPPNHAINLDPTYLFEKLVVRGMKARSDFIAAKSRTNETNNDLDPNDIVSVGGYCMENSILFYHVLRALGFNVYMAGVRIRYRKDGIPHGDYVGWVHVVNIVTLPDGNRYSCDVSFGGDGPLHPVPLISSDEPGFEPPIVNNLGDQQIRLVHDHIPCQTFRTANNRCWIYQYRNGSPRPWNSFYAITETEFTPADLEVMNFYTGQSPQSFQTTSVLVIKFLLTKKIEEDKCLSITGKLMLVDDTVKRNMGGKTEIVKVCKDEAERVQALKDLFGIYLTEEEVAAIKGKISEIRSLS